MTDKNYWTPRRRPYTKEDDDRGINLMHPPPGTPLEVLEAELQETPLTRHLVDEFRPELSEGRNPPPACEKQWTPRKRRYAKGDDARGINLMYPPPGMPVELLEAEFDDTLPRDPKAALAEINRRERERARR